MGRFPALIPTCKRSDDQIQRFQNTSLFARTTKRNKRGFEVGLPRFLLGDPPHFAQITAELKRGYPRWRITLTIFRHTNLDTLPVPLEKTFVKSTWDFLLSRLDLTRLGSNSRTIPDRGVQLKMTVLSDCARRWIGAAIAESEGPRYLHFAVIS
jgi:hypothetical protein